MAIELHTWSTPNGRKASIMLEECGLDYTVHPVNIGAGEQFAPAFLALSPNNRIPAILDPDGPDGKPIALFESGAILIYLANKAGRLFPTEPVARYQVLQWLMWQMGGVGPMFGQANHFRMFAEEEIPYGIERYTKEAHRLYRVMDRRLADAAYLGGDDYSIADIATYPWVARYKWHGIELDEIPHVQRWFETIGARPAIVTGMAIP